MARVGIVGYGWVGKSMHRLFPDSAVYDISGIGDKKEINKCEIVFVCVPTPNHDKGKLDTSIVAEVISWCKADLIVVRSTVNPGDCEKLSKQYSKKIVFQPEYLGETVNHPLIDEKGTPFIIMGGTRNNCRRLINLYHQAYNANVRIRQCSLKEAEVIKLSENRAIFFKVMQCQELYDACEQNGVDYYTIRDAVYGDDPRFNLWFTFVYPEKRGADSKCIPKDVYAWSAWAESIDPQLTKKLLEVNDGYINNNTE